MKKTNAHLILLFVLILFFSCDELGFKSIETNDNVCPDLGLIMAQVSDQDATVKKAENYFDYPYILEVPPSDLAKNGVNLVPCNVSADQLSENMKVKFSGVIYTRDLPQDTLYDYGKFAVPVVLSKIKVKD